MFLPNSAFESMLEASNTPRVTFFFQMSGLFSVTQEFHKSPPSSQVEDHLQIQHSCPSYSILALLCGPCAQNREQQHSGCYLWTTASFRFQQKSAHKTVFIFFSIRLTHLVLLCTPRGASGCTDRRRFWEIVWGIYFFFAPIRHAGDNARAVHARHPPCERRLAG